MDHPCYKCGHSVEDGKPFCAQCGAPQIRVAMPEPVTVVAGNVSSSELPIFAADSPVVPGTLSASAFSSDIVWPRAFRACGIAALISIVLTSLRWVPPLFAMPGAGILAVSLYYRRNPGWRVDGGSGAKIGAVTGLLVAGVFAILFGIFLAVLQSGGEVRQQVIEALQQVASRSNDPQVQASFDLIVKPENMAKLILDVIFVIFFSIAAGSLAGALTGAFLGRRNRAK
jgi:hypothetical protein